MKRLAECSWIARRRMLYLAAAAVATFGARQAAAGPTCYDAVWDWDGDHYADAAATESSNQSLTNDLYCTGNRIEETGDCAPYNKNIHPRVLEVDNGIDDNCNGDVDEPVPYYYYGGMSVTDTSFTVVLQHNSQEIADALRDGKKVMAQTEVVDLRHSKTKVLHWTPVENDDLHWGLVHLGGLTAGTVYRARVRLQICTATACNLPTPFSMPYFQMTTGPSWANDRRANMVNDAMVEMSESWYQRVGYNGIQIDGTRYGASGGEMWCSEFYSWVADPFVDFGGPPPSTVDDMVDAFEDEANVVAGNLVPEHGRPGDYLAIDSNHDGVKNHSGMLLAWDWDTWTVWSVEGNSGNQVKVPDAAGRPLGDIMLLGTVWDSMIE